VPSVRVADPQRSFGTPRQARLLVPDVSAPLWQAAFGLTGTTGVRVIEHWLSSPRRMELFGASA